MNTKILLFIIFAGRGLNVHAQDPVPKLIVSEIYMLQTTEAYAEITNMGDQPVDLTRVIFSVSQNNQPYREDTVGQNTQFLGSAGILGPGESFVVINYRTVELDSTDILTPSWYFEKADYRLFYTRRIQTSGLRFLEGDDALGLFWDKDGDRIFDRSIDTLLDEVGYEDIKTPFSVAGVTNASITHALIRKANVPEGNAGDFANSADISPETSEWIVVPYNPYTLGSMFTTVGQHGADYTWEFSPKSGTIDEDGLTIPWGTWRDSSMQISISVPIWPGI